MEVQIIFQMEEKQKFKEYLSQKEYVCMILIHVSKLFINLGSNIIFPFSSQFSAPVWTPPLHLF